MNKFDGLDVVYAKGEKATSENLPKRKSSWWLFFAFAVCCVVAFFMVFNMLEPVKLFLQSEYDYNNCF